METSRKSNPSSNTKTATVNSDGNTLQLAYQLISTPDAKSTIVFLHDSLGCISVWKGFPERLCKHLKTNGIVYDRQGHGLSCPFSIERRPDYMIKEANILNELLSAIEKNDDEDNSKTQSSHQEKAKKYILFGHSDGGSIAILMAALHPQRVKAIITEGAHVFNEELTLNGIRAASEVYRTTDLKQRLERYHGDKTSKLFGNWSDVWQSKEFRNFSIEHYLPQVKCPVLSFQGVDDEYGSVSQLDAIVSQVGTDKAQKALIENAAHTPHKENLEKTIEIVNAFLSN